MRKIIVTEFITLDGVIEAPGGDETNHPHGGWNAKFNHPDTSNYKVEELGSVDVLLLGRKTYDQFAAYWPTQTGTGFAERINQMPKYIVSHSLQKTGWNNCHIIRDIATEIAALKKTEGGDILGDGSATLAKALLHHCLIDELRLMLHPVSIGGGLKLFDENLEFKKFALKSSKAIDNGVIILEYLPVN